jgi:hypothetical protein
MSRGLAVAGDDANPEIALVAQVDAVSYEPTLRPTED